MQYNITAVEKKNNDWLVVSGRGLDGTTLTDASVNRTNKKGETFPNFDSIAVGATVEGEPWNSQTGKAYLFPPRKGGFKGAPGGGASTAVLKEILEQLKTISSQIGFYQTYVTRGEKPLDAKPVAPKYPDFDEKVDASNIPF